MYQYKTMLLNIFILIYGQAKQQIYIVVINMPVYKIWYQTHAFYSKMHIIMPLNFICTIYITITRSPLYP